MSVSRPTNPLVFSIPIGLGLLAVGAAIFLAVYLAPSIERTRANKQKNREQQIYWQRFGKKTDLDSVNWELALIDSQIETTGEFEEFRKRNEARRKKQNLNPTGNAAPSNEQSSQTPSVEELKRKKEELIARKNKLVQELAQPAEAEAGNWFEDYNLGLLLRFSPIVLLTLYLIGWMFSGKLPKRNPLSLTDSERKSVVFGIIALLVSVLVVALYVWFISIS